MLPFLVDVTGNSLDLDDALVWWDDLDHFANWFLLLTGVGLLVCGSVQTRWAVVAVGRCLGAVLAIGWEVGRDEVGRPARQSRERISTARSSSPRGT